MNNITHYELTSIIDANIPDNEHSEIIKGIEELINKNNGEISSTENLGRKKLSYPIKKLLKGVFICIEFDVEARALKTIEKELKLNKSIIRYLIVKKPKNVKKIINQKEKNNKIQTSNSEKTETKKVKKQEKEEIIKEKKNNDDSKTNLQDLDKKLDEILNDKIID